MVLLLFRCLIFVILYGVLINCDSPPNIIVLLADDLGYGDLSLHPFTGSTHIKTPNLEEMGKRSAVMTNFHVAAPICTPSRAAIMTGMFPYRIGIHNIFGTGPQAKDHLSVMPNAPSFFD